MKKGKKILIAVLVLVLLVAAGIVYVVTNIDYIVKAAIEKYGTLALKTTVQVSSVDIRLSSGSASVNGLTVGNPPGFTDPHIFSLGTIAIRIEPRAVARKPLVIQEIRIAQPSVFYEMNRSGESNVDAITRRLQGPEGAEKPEGKRKNKELLLSIRKLVIEQGRVEARAAAAGNKSITLDLPRLEMSNIGGAHGAPPEEIAKTIATALARQTAGAVGRSLGERYLRKGAEDLLKRYLEKQH